MKTLLRMKVFLVVAGLLLGGVSVWAAGYTRTLNEELSVPGYKAKAFYNFQNNTPAVLPTDGDLRYRDGDIWGFHNFGSGGRTATATIPVAAGEILVIQKYATEATTINRGVENAGLSSSTGYCVFDITETANDVAFTVPRYGGIVAALVMEKDANVETANYTIKYMSGDKVVKTTEGSITVGTVVVTEASFFAEDTKYFRADSEPENFTIRSGSNEFTVKVRVAETFSYSLKSNLGGVIAEGKGWEGETATVPYPRYVLTADGFYESDVTNKEYRKPIALSANNVSETVNYAKKDVKDVVFYAEGEDIEGMTESTKDNIPVRASNAKAGVSSEEVLITTLPVGKYVFHIGMFTSKSNDKFTEASVLNIGIGGETESFVFEGVNLSEKASKEYELNSPTEIKYLGTSTWSDAQLDYIWIEKTGDAEAEPEPEVKEPILTLKGKVGEEVTLTLGVYDYSDIYSVDFGDGTLKTDSVGYQNGGVKDENGKTPEGTEHASATEFKGTVSGDGIIKVYGTSDLWLVRIAGDALPEEFKAIKKVRELSISSGTFETLDLTGVDSLTSISVTNTPIRTINVSNNPELTSLTVIHTTVSAYNESPLESIDVSKNAKLSSINLGSSFYRPGKLTTVDLSANKALTNVVISNNKLTSIKLPEGAAISQLSVDMNELETLDLSKLGSIKSIQANDNKLTSVDLSKMVNGSSLNFYLQNNQLEGTLDLTHIETFANVHVHNNKLTSVKVNDVTKQFYVDGNNMTLATIPAQPAGLSSASKTKQFHYAPQAALEVAESITGNGELDLTSQLTVAKGELNPDGYTAWLENATTTYGFVTAEGTALVEGTDYEVVEPGKFKFVKAQTEKVHAVMLNSAFPKFTEAAPFVTTEFTVDETVGIQNVNAADAAGKVYNLQGVEVKQPQKGLYIQNGKKMVSK